MSTVFQEEMRARGLSTAALLRKANAYHSSAGILTGKMKAGPRMRSRLAEAMGRPIEELFDSEGWALSAATSAVS